MCKSNRVKFATHVYVYQKSMINHSPSIAQRTRHKTGSYWLSLSVRGWGGQEEGHNEWVGTSELQAHHIVDEERGHPSLGLETGFEIVLHHR